MYPSNELSYLETLKKVRDFGDESTDRTGTGTIRYPGIQMRFNLQEGFPILTTKKVLFYPMLVELLWFMQGRNDLKWLQDRKCNIWNLWHNDDGTIGPGYGVQWRKAYNGPIHSIDQLKNVVNEIKTNPSSRRLMVNAWSVQQVEQMALPPCHFCFQFLVNDGTLNCMLYQRSGDMFLGVPFNIASYALLLNLIAIECNLVPGEVIHTIGDAHIYKNHLEQVEVQLSRKIHPSPILMIDDDVFPEGWDAENPRGLMYWIDNYCRHKSLDELKELFKLTNYVHEGFLKAPVAI